jgi:hypothetical protein
MTIHARLGRRNAGKGGILDGGMAITAVDAELADVMLMAEGNGLDAGEVRLRYIGRPTHDVKKPSGYDRQDRQREKAGLGDGIEAPMKNLRHNASSAAGIVASSSEILPSNPSVFYDGLGEFQQSGRMITLRGMLFSRGAVAERVDPSARLSVQGRTDILVRR